MVKHSRAFRDNSAEIFAEAVERIQAGEPLEVVLASYPPEYRSNLHSLLAVVLQAQEIQQAPVPLPAPARRVAHKQAFLQAAAEKRAEQSLIEAVWPTAMAAAEQRRSFWTALLEAFTVRPMRLAPVAFMIPILLLASTTVVTLAQEAVPGDRTYPIKQWIRQQELYLSPPEQRAQVRQDQEEELVEDLKKATARPDLNAATIEAEGVLLFHGYGAGYLNIGGLRVLPQYEPDPNDPRTQPMLIVGDLEPGKLVDLRYRVLPGQAGSAVPMVQGISLEVIEQQPPEPTPLPTATPTISPDCEVVVQPGSGWRRYNVGPGEQLVDLAKRTGSTLEELRAVNCLASEVIVEGAALLLPMGRTQPEGEVSPVSPQPTDTLAPTTVISDIVQSTPTETSVLTTTEPVVSPATSTPGATDAPTQVFTVTVIAPPGETAWPSAPPTTRPSITSTVEAAPTTTLSPEDLTATVTPWPTATPTAEQPITATQEAPLTATASPDAPPIVATYVTTATVSPEATTSPDGGTETATATAASSPVVSSTSTHTLTPEATPNSTETPTAQVTPSATAEVTPSVITPEASATASATPEPTVEEALPTATIQPTPQPTVVEAPPTATTEPAPDPTEAAPTPMATSVSPPEESEP